MDKAIEQCSHSLTIDPYNAKSHLNLGMAHLRKEDWVKALEHLEMVLLLEPGNSWAHIYAGLAFGSSGKTARAGEHLETALELKPYIYNAAVYVTLGDYYNIAGRPGDAIPVLEKALSQRPDSPKALNTIGNSHFLLGDFKKAREKYLEALNADPYSPEPRYNLIKAYLKEGDARGVKSELAALKDVSPEYAEKMLGDEDYLEFIREGQDNPQR
jgi:tetratricopeptide (TPR) repeat protein